MGEIITFYSYKGGTGRSMALANVGWILASAGKKVLMVDWDLEAPGLHRYVHPFLLDKELSSSRGLIDVVLDFSVQAMTPGEGGEWYRKYADILRYALSLDWPGFGQGRLDFLPAGQQNVSYGTRVNSFNWDTFYERLGGGTFLEAVKESMKSEYDYVLIDSRTGVSDTSGICTVQMPDKVVVCFTLNRQSIQGAAAVAESIVEARARQPQLPPLVVFPVPTRVERTEHIRLEASRKAAQDLFAKVLGRFEDAERAKYWSEIEVYYQAYYALEEILAPFGDARSEVGSLLYSVEKLAWYLTGVDKWDAPSAAQKREVVRQYLRVVPAVEGPANETPEQPEPFVLKYNQAPVATIPSPREPGASRRFWFFLSWADPEDHRLVQSLWEDISRQIGMLRDSEKGEPAGFVDLTPIETGVGWNIAVMDAIRQSRTAVCLISPRYIQSESAGRKFSLLRAAVPVLPVMWGDLEIVPGVLADLQFAGNPDVQKRGLRNTMRLPRYRDLYLKFVEELAAQIVELGAKPAASVSIPENLDKVPNAFAETRSPGSEVLFVYAVPTLGEASTLISPSDRYGESPGAWRPYGERRLDEIASSVATELGLRYRGIPSNLEALGEIERWQQDRQICLMVSDPSYSRQFPDNSMLRNIWIQQPIEPAAITPYYSGRSRTVRGEVELIYALRDELSSLRLEAIQEAAARIQTGGPSLPRIT